MPEANACIVGPDCFANAGAVVGASVAHIPTVVGQTHHSYAAGLALVENHVECSIVGHKSFHAVVQQVVAGHTYVVAEQETIPRPVTSYVAGAPPPEPRRHRGSPNPTHP